MPICLCVRASDHSLIRAVLVDGEESVIESDTLDLLSSESLTFLLWDTIAEDSFQYQLIGPKEYTKQSELPVISFAQLGVGDYTFLVKSVHSDKIGMVKPLFIKVRYSYKDNFGFILLLIFYLLLIVGAAAYLISLGNFRHKEKLAALRNDWTNKLHNDIGGDLSSVALRLETLKRKVNPSEERVLNRLSKSYAILSNIQKKLRFLFDLVDPKKNSLHVMLEEVNHFARENFQLKEIKYHYHNELIADQEYNIDIGRINKLYLAMKESVNNCVKYSDAENASIHLRQSKDGLQVEIKDNGRGFNIDTHQSGNGISNLRQYSQEGFIDIDINSKIGEGTTVTMVVPNI